MNKLFTTCLITLLIALPGFSQTLSLPDSTKGNPFTITGRYAVGASSFVRYSPVEFTYGFEQDSWWMFGGGVSAIRYSSDRWFWSVSLGYASVAFDRLNMPDVRLIPDPNTGQYELQELGTRDEKWQYNYITLPVDFHHLVFDTKTTNLYMSGGVVLDWVRRLKREFDTTYDGRFDEFTGASFVDVSATVRAGVGLYQPLGRNFVLMLGLRR